jgi:hypothetical protein
MTGKRGRVDHDARPTPTNTPTGVDVDIKAEEQQLAPEDQAVADEAVAQAEDAAPVGPKKCADCGSRSIAVTTPGVAGAATNYCEQCRPANLR